MNGLRRNDADALDRAGTLSQPLVSIVILNWNGRQYLQQYLPFVLASTYGNKQVIVVDNASTDDSLRWLKSNFPEVRLMENTTNKGFAGGYQTALQQITSDYYVLLNSDVEVAPGWIEPVIDLMEESPLIAACQPKILDAGNRTKFEYAGAAGGWLDIFGYPFARGRVFDITETDRGQYDDPAACFWASGAALFVKAACYHEAGGLDSYFFAHQEEIDFCWRLQLAGYKVYVQPASVVYHVGGGTLHKEHPFKTYLNFRNGLIMLAKNLPVGRAIPIIIGRLLLDGVALWRELLQGRPRMFAAITKSHFYFIMWLIWERHKAVFPKQRKGQPAGLYPGSVVWQHFIKKKNTFSEIIGNK